MKILLLDDDPSLNNLIKNILEEKGFFVESFHNGNQAMTAIFQSYYDLYILDLEVPGFSGHEVLEKIRELNQDLPVIIISAQNDIDNIAKAYELGCNDYLKKPFEIEELMIHLQYHIKNFYQKENKNSIILGHGFEFDVKQQQLKRFDQEIELTQKERAFLSLLVQHLNQTVCLELIHEYVWNSKAVESVSMRSMIHKLQKKLKQGMIVNIRGVGYKFLSQEK
jgi:DNA-binding response OmpR family regulator